MLEANHRTIGARMTTTNWYVNPVSGNDNNSGTSPSSPVKTIMFGIVGKSPVNGGWGTQSPILTNNTIINLVASETIGQEEISISPLLVGGVDFQIIGTPANVGSVFSPTTVTAKVRGNILCTLLQLSGVPGSPVPGMVIYNSTKGSYAFIDAVVGTIVTVTQPFTGLTTVGLSTIPAEDDTWSTTDSYQLQTLPKLNLKYLHPAGGDAPNTALTTPVCWIQGVHVLDTSGTAGYSTFTVNGQYTNIVFSLCSFDPQFIGIATIATIGQNFSCWHNGGGTFTSWTALGGASNTAGLYTLAGTYLENLAAVDGDIIIHGALIVKMGYSLCGYAYIDSKGSSTAASASLRIEPYYYSGCQLYGAGNFDVDGGGSLVNESGGTWASCLTIGPLLIDGLTTGTKYVSGVWTDGVSVTSANLDTYSALQNPKTGSRYSMA